MKSTSLRWGDAGIYFDSDGSRLAVLDIPASMLHLDGVSDTKVPQWHGLIFDVLKHGGRLTRFDVALDFYDGVAADLIDRVMDACERDQLCGARNAVFHKGRKIGGSVNNHGVSIGKRGTDGSGRFVRFYDKGLETGEQPIGRWVRMECEFCSDVSHEVGMKLADLQPDTDWYSWLRAIVVGAIDFRDGDHHQSVKLRPRLDWWEKVVEGNAVRVVAERKPASWRGTANWLATVVAPKLAALSDHARLSFERLLAESGWLGHLNDKALKSQSGREFVAWWRSQAGMCGESKPPKMPHMVWDPGRALMSTIEHSPPG